MHHYVVHLKIREYYDNSISVKLGGGGESGKGKQLNLEQDVNEQMVQIHPCHLQAARKYHRTTNCRYGNVSLLLLTQITALTET